MKYWKQTFATQADGKLTASEDSLIVSILSAGTFFGALLAAPCADILGRRIGLMSAIGFVFNFGVILQTVSTSQPLFIAGRFFAGLGVGLVSAMSKFTRRSATTMHPTLTNTWQSPCTSPRLRPSGSVVSLSDPTSLLSPSVCSWQLSLIIPLKTAWTLDRTAFRSRFSSSGPSSSSSGKKSVYNNLSVAS
jgi:MFS family permease